MFKLFIYDTLAEDNKEQAEERFGNDSSVIHLPCTGREDLEASLRGLLALDYQFDRVLVQTHGDAGELHFGTKPNEIISHAFFSDHLPAVMDISALFPFYTRIYFDGCSVGSGENGTYFLKAVGKGLLKKRGGEVAAWTSPGYAFSSWLTVPFGSAGETVHFWGDLKRAYFVNGRAIKVEQD